VCCRAGPHRRTGVQRCPARQGTPGGGSGSPGDHGPGWWCTSVRVRSLGEGDCAITRLPLHDVPIYDCLMQLAERGEDPKDYASIWYYYW